MGLSVEKHSNSDLKQTKEDPDIISVWKCENETVKVKCESESAKVKVWKWKCESESVRVKVWEWKCESESVKVKLWNCESVKVHK